MEKVILDANILIAPFQLRFNIDAEIEALVGEYEGYVPEPIIGEIKRLNIPENRKKAALALARRYVTVETESVGDEAVLEAAEKLGAILVSADRHLQKRAIKVGLRVIGIREGHRLTWFSEEV